MLSAGAGFQGKTVQAADPSPRSLQGRKGTPMVIVTITHISKFVKDLMQEFGKWASGPTLKSSKMII